MASGGGRSGSGGDVMRSWQGRSCRKMVRQFTDELSIAAACRWERFPDGGYPRPREEIEADITLWRSRLAGPEPTPEPEVPQEARPVCRQCGQKLRPTFEKVSVRVDTSEGFHTVDEPGKLIGFGYNARGHFCSLHCGWRFAVDTVEGKAQ